MLVTVARNEGCAKCAVSHVQEVVTVKLPALLAETDASDTAPADAVAVTPSEVSALIAAARLAAMVLTVSFIPKGAV